VAAGHLVALGNLPLLGNHDAHALVDTGRKLVILLGIAIKHPDVDHLAVHAVRHAQRGVLYFAGLLTEDRPKQALFRAQLGLTSRRNLANENVIWMNLGANADNAVLIEIRQALLADIRDVSRDLFGTQLGIAGIALVLLNVDRRVHVIPHEPLTQQNGILKVAAVPWHEGHHDVLAKSQFAFIGGRGVSNNLLRLHPIASVDNRPLVDAGVLVRPHEFSQAVDPLLALVAFNYDLIT